MKKRANRRQNTYIGLEWKKMLKPAVAGPSVLKLLQILRVVRRGIGRKENSMIKMFTIKRFSKTGSFVEIHKSFRGRRRRREVRDPASDIADNSQFLKPG